MHKISANRGFFPVVLALLICAQTSHPQVLPKDLDAYVEKVQKEFEVPGLALAVVKDGNVLLAKGYGVRKLGEPARVDEHTLFGIASNTKAFTATAIGLLVEEGKLEWDAPVVRYLPWFALSDPYVTREITIRDLLVHRSGLGLGAGDLLWCRLQRTIAGKSPSGCGSYHSSRVFAAPMHTTTCCTWLPARSFKL
jgi:CubicO group peptidase (beta-lactamase class C family)